MTVYILHLDTPLHHARHYTGFSTNGWTLRERIEHHRHGTASCNFTRVLHALGISFTLARVFKGKQHDRNFERALKNTKNVPYYCPICNPNALQHKPRKK